MKSKNAVNENEGATEAAPTEAPQTGPVEAPPSEPYEAANPEVSESNETEESKGQPEDAQSQPKEPEAQSKIWKGKTHQNLKVVLSDFQILSHGREQAKLLQSLARLEEEEKQVKAHYKAKKEKLLADIKFETQIVNNGYIFKEVECEVRFNDPISGEKTIVRLDTGDVVGIEMMDYHEVNRRLFKDEEIGQVANGKASNGKASDGKADGDTPDASENPSESASEDESSDSNESAEKSTDDIFPVNGAANGTVNGAANNAASSDYQFEEDPPPAPEMPQMMDQANEPATNNNTPKARSRKAAST